MVRDDQSGAVALRAHRVHPAYERAAGGLDTRFYTAPLTPVLDRLNQHGRVRALVFGNHGEASPDVHHFIAAAARKLARSTWVRLGARSEDEAYGCHVQRFRRDVGIAVAREFARYRRGYSCIRTIDVRTGCTEAYSPQSHDQLVQNPCALTICSLLYCAPYSYIHFSLSLLSYILEISGLGLSLPEEEPGALYFVFKKWAFVSAAFSARLVVIQS